MALDDAVNDGKPQSRALTLLFRGKKRFEDSAANIFIDSLAGIRHLDRDIGGGFSFAMAFSCRLSVYDVSPDDQGTAARITSGPRRLRLYWHAIRPEKLGTKIVLIVASQGSSRSVLISGPRAQVISTANRLPLKPDCVASLTY
jgi:hypothetical protein